MATISDSNRKVLRNSVHGMNEKANWISLCLRRFELKWIWISIGRKINSKLSIMQSECQPFHSNWKMILSPSWCGCTNWDPIWPRSRMIWMLPRALLWCLIGAILQVNRRNKWSLNFAVNEIILFIKSCSRERTTSFRCTEWHLCGQN